MPLGSSLNLSLMASSQVFSAFVKKIKHVSKGILHDFWGPKRDRPMPGQESPDLDNVLKTIYPSPIQKMYFSPFPDTPIFTSWYLLHALSLPSFSPLLHIFYPSNLYFIFIFPKDVFPSHCPCFIFFSSYFFAEWHCNVFFNIQYTSLKELQGYKNFTVYSDLKKINQLFSEWNWKVHKLSDQL